MTPEKALETAVKILDGQSAFARACGGDVKQQHVHYWLKVGKIPAEHCLAIERATKRKVTRYDLRPDVFGEPRRRHE
jgi:DNA-binding transcriptional regulator YdaS (Cro superfamily)